MKTDIPTSQDKCDICGREIHKNGRKTRCNSCSVRVKRMRNKIAAVCYLGGKCQICGIVDDPSVYDFHHLNGEDKDFRISGKLDRTSWEIIQNELDKCDLLCSRCHRKVHSKYDDTTIIEAILDLRRCQKGSVLDIPSVFDNLPRLVSALGFSPDIINQKEQEQIVVCEVCGKTLHKDQSRFCSTRCKGKSSRKVDRPSRSKLSEMLKEMSINAIAKLYGVSWHAVRKWMDGYGMSEKSVGSECRRNSIGRVPGPQQRGPSGETNPAGAVDCIGEPLS